jgi:hypothetical protein
MPPSRISRSLPACIDSPCLEGGDVPICVVVERETRNRATDAVRAIPTHTPHLHT